MTPVISRHIWCTVIETKNYRIESKKVSNDQVKISQVEVQVEFAFRKHAEIYT